MAPKLEDFKIIATIGSGANGTVRKVRRRKDGLMLVWKEINYGMMNEAEKQGLVLEVNLLRELRHPNIVHFIHHIVHQRSTTLYILMEYCPGGDLKSLISKCRQTGTFLEEGFIWRVFKQVCEALKACHRPQTANGRLILHRDIKPANIFLDVDGNMKLGDFGLARTLNSDGCFATTFVGTPYYMSPEVIEGREYNDRSDIWSLGCLVYELCALHPPFEANTQTDLARKIKVARYEKIPIQYSSEMQEMIAWMLTHEDYLRPSSLMILHHSALLNHTSTQEKQLTHSTAEEELLQRIYDVDEEDPFASSVSPNPTPVLTGVGKGECSADTGIKVSRIFQEIVPECVSVMASDQEFNAAPLTDENCNAPQVVAKKSSNKFDTSQKDISCNELDSKTDSLPNRLDKIVEFHVTNCLSEKDIPHRYNVECLKIELKPFDADCVLDVVNDDILEKNENDVKNEVNSQIQSPEVLSMAEFPEIKSQSNFHKKTCACTNLSPEMWRNRLSDLRMAESKLKQREIDLEGREREVEQNERRVAAMEREARQHLVRAQIYLRTARTRSETLHSAGAIYPPAPRYSSDLDTTVSGDVGTDNPSTVTKPDPSRLQNPFLLMRQQAAAAKQIANKQVSFKALVVTKCNTLDNPRSHRLKCKGFTSMDRGTDTKKDKGLPNFTGKSSHRQPLENLANFGKEKWTSGAVLCSDKIENLPPGRFHTICGGQKSSQLKTTKLLRSRCHEVENMSKPVQGMNFHTDRNRVFDQCS